MEKKYNNDFFPKTFLKVSVIKFTKHTNRILLDRM